MRICVVGASGLIGKSLTKHLLTLPEIEVTAFARRPAPEGIIVRWLRGDLQNLHDCARLVEGQDIIFHLAHTNSPLTSGRDMVQDSLFNLIPTLRLLKAIKVAGCVPHVVYASSGGSVYGNSESKVPCNESHPCLPLSSYGIQKLTAEHYLRLAAHHGTLSATVLRIGNAYGWLLPPTRSQGFIGTAVMRVLTGQPVRVFGSPANVRDYIYIEDVINAFMLAAQRCREFEIYNIGTGVGTSVAGVLKIIERVVGRRVPRVVEDVESADYLPDWCILDAEKAYRELGWRSRIPIEEGIRRMFEQRPDPLIPD